MKPRDVIAALSIDHSELAKMRTVTTVLSSDILHRIGRAPGVGRPRWFQLAEAVKSNSSALGRIQRMWAAAQIPAGTSDQRFAHALTAALAPKPGQSDHLGLVSPTGEAFGAVAFGPAGARFTVERQYAVAFKAFLKEEAGAVRREVFLETWRP